MATFFTELRQMIVPDMRGKQGPLPQLLIGMTLVTGLVDAFSYLVLGHVFVANMTGNVVLLGFALAGAPGFSIPASGGAILSFALGALVGGHISTRLGQHRGRLLSTAAGLQTALFAASVVLAAVSDDRVTAAYRYTLIVLLAVSMGIQNAAARKLAVPDLTTTVLTMTLTGIAADRRGRRRQGVQGWASLNRGCRHARWSARGGRTRDSRSCLLSPAHCAGHRSGGRGRNGHIRQTRIDLGASRELTIAKPVRSADRSVCGPPPRQRSAGRGND